MRLWKLWPVRSGVLMTAVIAAVFSCEVFADQVIQGAIPSGKPNPQVSSSVLEKQPSSVSQTAGTQSPITQTIEIEGIRLAAEGGLAQAQCDLGFRYQIGNGVSKDSAQALLWFRKAAEQGFDEAQYLLGCCYNGEEGFTRDPSEAVRWWKKAAAQGHVDAEHLLGLSYAIGEGVPQNPAEAVKWWRKAAEQRHADAQYFLGLSYVKGLGVPRVPEQGAYWLRQAAAQGNENALAVLKQLGVQDRN